VSVRSLRSEPSGRIDDKRLSPTGSEWNTIHGPGSETGPSGGAEVEVDPGGGVPEDGVPVDP
jgi:hypothetical protein